jgi:hypothetical protein
LWRPPKTTSISSTSKLEWPLFFNAIKSDERLSVSCYTYYMRIKQTFGHWPSVLMDWAPNSTNPRELSTQRKCQAVSFTQFVRHMLQKDDVTYKKTNLTEARCRLYWLR